MPALAYNSNVHPAESVDELIETFDQFSGPLRQQLDWPTLGIDLRIGSAAIAECEYEQRLSALAESLKSNKLSAHTLNGFPLSPFQLESVKDQAYVPDWLQEQRLQESIALIDIALALSDEDFISISTLPASFKPWAYHEQLLCACAQAFGRWVAVAAQRFEQHQRCVHLAIEPEPWCFLENTHETLAFWQGPLAEYGVQACAEALGGDRKHAEEAIQRHLGICFDTCHVSLAYEDQQHAVAKLTAAGIPIKKVQFSAALEVANPHQDQDGLQALIAMQEPRFLHQCAIESANGSLLKVLDLDQLASAVQRLPNASSVRSHFHIPIFWPSQQQGLSSTIAESTQGLYACLAAGAEHIAVETYTWSVLESSNNGILDGCRRELEFLQNLMSAV